MKKTNEKESCTVWDRLWWLYLVVLSFFPFLILLLDGSGRAGCDLAVLMGWVGRSVRLFFIYTAGGGFDSFGWTHFRKVGNREPRCWWWLVLVGKCIRHRLGLKPPSLSLPSVFPFPLCPYFLWEVEAFFSLFSSLSSSLPSLPSLHFFLPALWFVLQKTEEGEKKRKEKKSYHV